MGTARGVLKSGAATPACLRAAAGRRASVARPGSRLVCSASAEGEHKRVLVLGGTGRVGSSTAAALLKLEASYEVLLGGRKQSSYDDAVERRPELKGAPFVKCDINDGGSLKEAFEGVDLVVHAAGPFQRKTDTAVLDQCIATGTPYMDICDDSAYSELVKAQHSKAAAAGVPAITTAGIYPGVSNLMAAHMISIARGEYDEDFNYVDEPEDTQVDPTRVLYSYFTAGSGGAGPTILETSFLLAGEEVTAFKDGKPVTVPPITEQRVVDFGPGVRRRSVYLYQLPEVASTHKYLRVPNVSARFGTDPEFWNWAMVAVARLVPKAVLEDREAVAKLAKAVDPLVRSVDKIVGEKVSMKIEIDFTDGTSVCGLYSHKFLSESVGTCTAAFADAMLQGGTQPGVWFPEQPQAVKNRVRLLEIATKDCFLYGINKPFWEIEGEPLQLGMGMYL